MALKCLNMSSTPCETCHNCHTIATQLQEELEPDKPLKCINMDTPCGICHNCHIIATQLQEELDKLLFEDDELQTLGQQEEIVSLQGGSTSYLDIPKLVHISDSLVIILRNMVEPEDVDEMLQEEIIEECSKYGSVLHLIFYLERQNDEDDAEVIVKIFVEFSKHEESLAAKRALDGRYFGGRRVMCDLYDQNLYDQSDFSD